MEYRIEPPKFFRGTGVRFYGQNDGCRFGTIVLVETRYSHNHEAYHVYAISQPGHRRRQWISEENIFI